ncbi:MAG: hypothetical protein HY040_25180 [Planctomycetes bacterium]|nr:hypothetical protein [Planctomycetota bacterium]
MFGLFRSEPRCPVDPTAKEWIERRLTWLREQFGWDRLLSAEVVLPLPEYFPDPYQGEIDDLRALLDRVCEYMDIDPDTVDIDIYEDRNPVHDEHGRQGTAGLYDQVRGRYQIWIEVGNLDDPLALVATMAHELGHVLLLGQGRISADAEDHEPLTDLLTVFLGMGVIAANSVIREKYWHAGAVSGWDMSRRGYVTMPMYGYALALFAWVRGEENPPWAKELRGDVRAAFKEGTRYLVETGDSQFQPRE